MLLNPPLTIHKPLANINHKHKMKKVLLIITLFIVLGNVNAQTDATWEETTGFILKYSQYINYGMSSEIYRPQYKTISDFKINKNVLVFNRIWSKDKLVEVKFDLNKLQNVSLNNIEDNIESGRKGGSNIKIELTGLYGMYGSNKIDLIYFEIEDVEIKKRLLSAFQHLTKLAKEKRELENKASGDKF